MFRSSLIVAGAALLCSTAAAQHRIDPARLVPITGSIRDAGTVNVFTGEWTAPGAQQKQTKAVYTVYNNTCTWLNPLYISYYAGYGECEDSYDEGSIPSTTRPGAPPEAADSQTMTSVAISYCTTAATPAGGVDIELAFWDKLNGHCVGGVPPTPPNWATTATAYIPLGGLGLPGTPTGTLACWVVTLDVSQANPPWVMQSDGDGIYNGLDDDDNFIWGKRFNTVSPSNGFVISGEPATGSGYGSCSYSIACGTDPTWAGGATCGTGLDTWDGEWINVDGVAVGSSAPTPPNCTTSVANYGYGTNCYWFGGYPTNPFDSYWLILEGETGAGVGTFCTSLPAGGLPNCTATLTAPAATVSKTTGAGNFLLSLGPVPGGPQAGVFIWAKSQLGTGVFKDPNVLQSQGGGFGWRCIIPTRGSPDLPGGNNGQCNGQYDWDLGNYLGGVGSGLIQVGNDLYIQGWFRDPTKTAGALFSQGVGPINVTP